MLRLPWWVCGELVVSIAVCAVVFRYGDACSTGGVCYHDAGQPLASRKQKCGSMFKLMAVQGLVGGEVRL